MVFWVRTHTQKDAQVVFAMIGRPASQRANSETVFRTFPRRTIKSKLLLSALAGENTLCTHAPAVRCTRGRYELSAASDPRPSSRCCRCLGHRDCGTFFSFGQERARLADPVKSKTRRRIVMGLREVLRGVKAKKVCRMAGIFPPSGARGKLLARSEKLCSVYCSIAWRRGKRVTDCSYCLKNSSAGVQISRSLCAHFWARRPPLSC